MSARANADADILFAWEMGANLGHIARDLALAIACREAGHAAMSAVKDLSVCVNAARELGIDFVQAPALSSKQMRQGMQAATRKGARRLKKPESRAWVSTERMSGFGR
jgi:UDP:flavonoid glycosyltransferase YjiC (YdhE family)